jgi:hypothetical protein
MLLAPLVFLLGFGLTGALAGAIYSRSWRSDRSVLADAAIGAVGWVAVWLLSWFLSGEWPSPLWTVRQGVIAVILSIGVAHLITVRRRSGGRDRLMDRSALEKAESDGSPGRD